MTLPNVCPADGLAHTGNPIVVENGKAGIKDWWVPYPQWSLDHEVEGFTESLSYAPGDALLVHASTEFDGDPVNWWIFRTGYYNGCGARLVAEGHLTGKKGALPAASTWDVPAEADWAVLLRYTLPSDLVSGVYALRLDNVRARKSFLATFVVRDDTRSADLAVQRSDFTDMAYNNWDGQDNTSSWYGTHPQWVSYRRPSRSPAGYRFPYSAGYFTFEYALVRWLERNGYDAVYLSNYDLHARPHSLDNVRVFVSVGHDEYWSAEMRDQIEGARDAGKSLVILSTDTCDSEIRFDRPGDPTAFAPYPVGATPLTKKAEWVDKPINLSLPPHDNPSDTLIGTHYSGWCGSAHMACLTDGIAKFTEADMLSLAMNHPVFRGAAGSSGKLPHLMGYEYETEFYDPTRLPFSLQKLGVVQFPPQTMLAPPMTVAYQLKNGAKVFNAGSSNWSQALDGWSGRAVFRDSGGERACMASEYDCFDNTNLATQQITSNIFTDVGVVALTPDPKLRQDDPCDWLNPEPRCMPTP
jgi:hypothetical protein